MEWFANDLHTTRMEVREWLDGSGAIAVHTEDSIESTHSHHSKGRRERREQRSVNMNIEAFDFVISLHYQNDCKERM